jgi:CDP-diacylglycerol--serine O-phosphatidyltransferase
MVSFGLAPGIMVYSLIDQSVASPDAGLNFLALPAFLLTLFSALRLGLFNLDTEQQKDFRGLPTPANTTYFAGLMLICHFDSFGLKEAVGSLPFLYLNILLFSFLLISPLPMFSLKTKHFRWAGNELRYTFILLVILLILFLQEAAFSVIILLYVLISFIRHLSRSPGLKATNRSDI